LNINRAFDLRDMASRRLRYFSAHLLTSAILVGVACGLVLVFWYPAPVAKLEGVYQILLVMACVDVCAGPLCTLVAAAPTKSRPALARDLAVIATVQLAALGLAVYTAAIARPAFIVYSVGQFEVEHANELTPEALAKAADPAFATAPWRGPRYVEAEFPKDSQEAMKLVNSAIGGGPDIKDLPQYYHAWPDKDSQARDKARPATGLSLKGELRGKVLAMLANASVPESDGIVLPISGKTERGTVVLRRSDLAILGVVPYLSP